MFLMVNNFLNYYSNISESISAYAKEIGEEGKVWELVIVVHNVLVNIIVRC